MSTALDVARATLLNPAELDESRLNRVLGGLMKPGIDAADLYFQFSKSEHWSLEEAITKCMR
jgi:TldD protein